ncbi:flagellar biosynthesis anti-sigma factor FlgM [Vibrio vulnificus]|nr:flagellar biosynthesis anti-sigma factor FlgM [Vibrio vulnificus]ELI3522795.1 flagellar biosynthesis anti-sigma factor FlgM [Vibrio vulnificus]
MASIDNIRSGQIITTNSRGPARADSNSVSDTRNEAKKSNVGQDAVSLSQQSRDIEQLHQEMASKPAFDAAKVAAIKEAIANGSYRVDPEKLADNMMKFENELADRVKA